MWLSLTGEPTLYSHVDELMRIFHKNGFTTFHVSNGTNSSALAKLNEEPTQLYISVCAPNKETLKKVCRPQISRGWEELNETLDNLPNFKCVKVIQISSVRCANIRNTEGYAGLIRKRSPHASKQEPTCTLDSPDSA